MWGLRAPARKIGFELRKLTPLKWLAFCVGTVIAAALSYYTEQFLRRSSEPLSVGLDWARTNVVDLSHIYSCDLVHNCPVDYSPILVLHNKSDAPVVIRDFQFRAVNPNPYFVDSETGSPVALCSSGSPLVEIGDNYTEDGGDIEGARIPPEGATTLPAGATRLVRVSFTLFLSPRCPSSEIFGIRSIGATPSKAEFPARVLGRHPNIDAHPFHCDEYSRVEITAIFDGNQKQSVRFHYPILSVGDSMKLFHSLMGCQDTVLSTEANQR